MSKIIDIQPTINPDGYFEDNINIGYSLNMALLKKIVELKNDNNFSQQDTKILKEITDSHKNLIEKKITHNKFMINKNEMNELKSIEEKNYSRYLIYRYKYRFFSKEKQVGEYPPCLQIEPTSICNFRCIMCYQADKSFSNKSKGFMSNMSLDLYKKVIDEVEGKVEAIHWHQEASQP